MKIVLTTLNAKFIHTALSLRLLKAYAEPEYEVEIKEYTIKDPSLNILSDLYEKNADVIGFSCYIWNIEKTIEIIKMLKRVKPSLRIILGGPEVSFDVPYWMDRIPEVDFIVSNEGEETFKHLLDEICGEQKYHLVFGATYRKDNEVIVNPPRPNMKLETIPTAYRFLEDKEDIKKRIIYFETSRGCPFSCSFCLSSIEVGVRYFDIERVKEDLLYLINNGAKIIKFIDRTFNIKRDYALEIFQFLIDNHQGCVFQFEITADIMRPEVLEFLNTHAPSGVFRFEIGIQSTNDATNELVNRRQNFEKLSRTVNMVKEGNKIDQHLDLIAGLPEEDYISFKKTFNDVFAMRPEELQLGFLKMLRGTGLRKQATQYGYVFMDHSPYEILQNDVLSFSEIIRIKRVEDILEKYWNAHRMDHTIEFLVEHEFPTAFDFFQEFGDYWDKQGWSKIGHQLEDLFLRIQQFLQQRATNNFEIIKGIMIYDFFLNHKHKPRKTWWDFTLTKGEQANLLEYVAENSQQVSASFSDLQLSVKDLHKHTMIEVLPFNIKHYFKSKEVIISKTLLITYFDPKMQKAYPFILPEIGAILKK
ncbi:B12-binding domain-containing radical SAM protein [Anaerobacillus alkalidiazotrophicus]|uniref:B12-binding domain-containing radical SAM protein n=1 Tax=Anaerobacillus alkalidiazotrophicus TaxID=472963 RepID=A0A1S2M5K0_9BACI|nr:B12-binding domain-containing radical SAM protein [Anaerobacillus alkalidiazotrophicus]OIJ18425.1 B12-binding domain-containing radical SAM protein [Anaerobacillus alkalidiazotrophicus]OIJ19904.1 B12-binding domain-containing radical SAM protein [Anaerobacillus alkalidiazotrophicus]